MADVPVFCWPLTLGQGGGLRGRLLNGQDSPHWLLLPRYQAAQIQEASDCRQGWVGGAGRKAPTPEGFHWQIQFVLLPGWLLCCTYPCNMSAFLFFLLLIFSSVILIVWNKERCLASKETWLRCPMVPSAGIICPLIATNASESESVLSSVDVWYPVLYLVYAYTCMHF